VAETAGEPANSDPTTREKFSSDPDSDADDSWDVIVVGAGLGGSVTGHSLAAQGLRVLFLEHGQTPNPPRRTSNFRRLLRKLRKSERERDLAARGWWSRMIAVHRDGQKFDFYPPLGTGPGGSSALYAAALERMRRIDFEGSMARGSDGARMPDGWPVDYDTFAEYYRRAEMLMGVCGSRDPLDEDDVSLLNPPPPLSERDQHFYDSFRREGLNPFRLHSGIAYRPGCAECIGMACDRGCKADGLSRALRPALDNHGAEIVLGCAVERLEAEGGTVSSVIGKVDGREVRYRGKIIVLAAGALSTPVLLMKSTSERWPSGIGNDNDLVGRGLMFHVSDFFALWPTAEVASLGPKKTLAFRDFYVVGNRKLGGVQSLGFSVSAHLAASYLDEWVRRRFRFAVPGSPILLRLVGALVKQAFRKAALFATVVEDFPYLHNRVTLDGARPGGPLIEYRKPPELVERNAMMRGLLKRYLEKHRIVFLNGDDNLNFGHPCGTCRFGDDPETSVLDASNKVRGMDNLYVVDASFFPSSAGANPALTVIANALRVGEIIGAGLRLAADLPMAF
jgi:choline dehydrogenase-like flavoprotein